ncbi:MAG: (R)-stereoselective amidase [Verrucomicrobiota bacterium]|jgi:predicted amidohydrolase
MKISIICLGLLSCTLALASVVTAPDGWTAVSPREEIRPHFAYDPRGGPAHEGSLVIQSDQREGLFGRWTKTFPVNGAQYYRFAVSRKASGAISPRRTGVARVLWRDDKGKPVKHATPAFKSYAPGDRPQFTAYHSGEIPTAEPEYPEDGATSAQGWTEVTGAYLSPPGATQAIVELEFRWEPRTRLEWAGLTLNETAPPPARTARLATVHFVPRGKKTAEARREAFEPLIAEAGAAKADLVVLPEVVTYGNGSTFAEVAEPIPGPSTEYFGALAKKHNVYLVPGLVEREGNLIYNVAVLIDPQGKVAGKYRKVCLPRGEIEAGITPGYDYPVFSTRFGKVGMMICYDGFYPEVARELANNGAEVIAWPVMGCNPMLGAARATENHVYIVSSTHTDVKEHWMISAVYGHDGLPLAQAKDWGTLAIAEVDLARPPHWPSLGNMRAEMPRHRPLESRAR